MGVLKEHGQENSAEGGARTCSVEKEGSCYISGIGIKSAGRGYSRARQHKVAVPNFWVKFSKCRILARGDSAKFLVSCFWHFVEF